MVEQRIVNPPVGGSSPPATASGALALPVSMQSDLEKLPRCPWAATELSVRYHDAEWGTPSHDDRHLFEMLILEGAQAGLSWETILRKRDRYRVAFDGFDPNVVAGYGEQRVARLLEDAGLIRNRLKIRSTIDNARALLRVREEFRSFDDYIWRFVDGSPRRNHFQTMADVPSQTVQSEAMSKDLKKRGFRFVGPTICYAFMQATGMVDDHLTGCFRRR